MTTKISVNSSYFHDMSISAICSSVGKTNSHESLGEKERRKENSEEHNCHNGILVKVMVV